MDLTEIKNDLYEVADRIREVGNYKLYYNRKKGRYEIHSPFGLELTLGSKTPTGEVVVRLRKTRMEKIDDLLKEIERENTLAEKAAKEKIIKKTELRYESH
ncbi:MAG: hypothetical protein MRZ86_04545 [Acidaminococcus sp.]|nr:hypothetical protein [Acidaminococcus sp.]MDD7398422.1 hypothetical protein [Bacillota bacterium]MDY4559830.1 hypothetical protein [Eubacteriales bacterium]